MATHLLQIQHKRGQLSGITFSSRSAMADVVVLAENASQVAPAEKDRTGTEPADQRGFFAEVRSHTGNSRFIICSAKTGVSRGSVNPALSRAKIA